MGHAANVLSITAGAAASSEPACGAESRSLTDSAFGTPGAALGPCPRRCRAIFAFPAPCNGALWQGLVLGGVIFRETNKAFTSGMRML